MPVITVQDCNLEPIKALLSKFNLNLVISADNQAIPGSWFGDSEAGLIENNIYVRKDTPIHSLLHESCHYICMDSDRRKNLHTNAAGDYDEENGVCYLQIILADDIPQMHQKRMMQDMDEWGYTFRLGSAQKWFEDDAQDTKQWLLSHKIIDKNNNCLYQLREDQGTSG
ncbi:MAG: hypothetical protein ISR69_04210 [Gammaproteobacteria bacterium]|nr:hypothetical protein [Gammaproteobacteria bacterium]